MKWLLSLFIIVTPFVSFANEQKDNQIQRCKSLEASTHDEYECLKALAEETDTQIIAQLIRTKKELHNQVQDDPNSERFIDAIWKRTENSQYHWKKYRDEECARIASLFMQGNGGINASWECRAEKGILRLKELKN
jgi:uncharacterized protein YecT (DUF1311 family)